MSNRQSQLNNRKTKADRLPAVLTAETPAMAAALPNERAAETGEVLTEDRERSSSVFLEFWPTLHNVAYERYG